MSTLPKPIHGSTIHKAPPPKRISINDWLCTL
jgi:hypothetical protein